MTTTTTRQTQTALRLPDELLARADKLAETMGKKTGLRITRAEVLRLSVSRGLERLESEGKKKR